MKQQSVSYYTHFIFLFYTMIQIVTKDDYSVSEHVVSRNISRVKYRLSCTQQISSHSIK